MFLNRIISKQNNSLPSSFIYLESYYSVIYLEGYYSVIYLEGYYSVYLLGRQFRNNYFSFVFKVLFTIKSLVLTIIIV